MENPGKSSMEMKFDLRDLVNFTPVTLNKTYSETYIVKKCINAQFRPILSSSESDIVMHDRNQIWPYFNQKQNCQFVSFSQGKLPSPV